MINPNTVDLNLLRVFEALVLERSVSGAAGRLCLSQPAVSNALHRLREVAGDPLFVRTRNGMEPTATALLLAEPIRQGLATIRAGLAQSAAFDPATSRRTFTILMNDVGTASLLPAALRRQREEAPNASIRVEERDQSEHEEMLDTGAADLAIGRLALSDTFRSEFVLASDYVALLRRDHPALADGRMTLERYAEAPQVIVAPRNATPNPVAIAMEELGLRPRVALSVPYASALFSILPEGDLVATMPDVCAVLMARDPRLTWVPLPFPVPATLVQAWWHKRHEGDPGHAWLRGLFRRG